VATGEILMTTPWNSLHTPMALPMSSTRDGLEGSNLQECLDPVEDVPRTSCGWSADRETVRTRTVRSGERESFLDGH
jgi:hypothetical protein